MHEFFQGFVNHAQVTLHIDNLRGDNAHHQCETMFKAFARALRMAAEPDPRAAGTVPSTKGSALAADQTSRVVDYGMGNLRSVRRRWSTSRPAPRCVVTADPEAIRAAERVVVPGPGRDARLHAPARRERRARGGGRGGARASPSSASASACRCCSSAARRATRRASGCCPAGCRAFRPQCSTAGAEGAAHGLERGAAGAAAPPVGGHRRTAAASISCTATTPRRAMRR